MEKCKVCSFQMFALIVLFEIGSAVVVGLGMDAKHDAWIAILLGMMCGLVLFTLYNYLFKQFPELPLTSYIEKILGKYIGKIISFIYILYFIYIAARVLRDFGDMIVTTTLFGTPLVIVNLLMILIIGYGIFLGIEVLGRSGEIFYIMTVALAFLFISLMFASDLPKIENLLPILEEKKLVIETTFPLTLTFPFGETIVFTMLLPYLKQSSKSLKIGLLAILFSGLLLSFTIALNISILGSTEAANTPFPLHRALGKINLMNFIQRLDSIVVFLLVLGGYFKIVIFSYAATIGLTNMFKQKKHQKLIFPVCLTVYISSILIASNFIEHIEIGLKKVPFYIHIPLQVFIPIILFLITLFRKRFIKSSYLY